MIGEGLKVNSTLTDLELERSDWYLFKNVLLFVIDQYSFTINGNKIGDSGACSIGEGLKVNSTLKTLYLWGEKEKLKCF